MYKEGLGEVQMSLSCVLWPGKCHDSFSTYPECFIVMRDLRLREAK